MRCRQCGGTMIEVVTDLPFKVSERRIVILKDLPVLECRSCVEYSISDAIFTRVERILGGVSSNAELEIIRFAA